MFENIDGVKCTFSLQSLETKHCSKNIRKIPPPPPGPHPDDTTPPPLSPYQSTETYYLGFASGSFLALVSKPLTN
jgi:hypothetical protein